MEISRKWAMPSHNTFSVKPIGEFVRKYLKDAKTSIDPFARNNNWATFCNDLNPETSADFHMDAVEFMKELYDRGHRDADLIILDPPYSPRQITECYASIGRKATMQDTQSSFYSKLRDAALLLCGPETTVISFGWNSVGMGKKRGFNIKEIMLVCHGGAHNDTICLAETMTKVESLRQYDCFDQEYYDFCEERAEGIRRGNIG